ncbi:MAG: Xaa-Pro aminopeptidase [Myxococcales bacterium]|nr:Xaa-Pro aminopeptidase [Myxococcales bacterium]
MTQDSYSARRARLAEAMGDGVAIVPAAPVAIRNNDVEHSYRQDSDLYYLTGFEEPESVLVLIAEGGAPRAVLFVRPRDPEREVWDGSRAGVEGAVERFGADEAFPITELSEQLPTLLLDRARVFYRLGRDRAFDERFISALVTVRGRARSGVIAPRELVDLGAVLHEQRLVKGPEELEAMRQAIAISREAHAAAMRAARPGAYEYEVEAAILQAFYAGGSARPAYDSIVGSGPNATVLHYRSNRRRMGDGELLLIDAGCELAYYASDVTRTFPVGGTFSGPQRAIYELVLRAQKASMAEVRPGGTLDVVHDAAVRVLTEGLIELGLIEGDLDAAIEEKRYRPFYMHRTSHWLGMDVHDVGDYYRDGAPRPLEPGFVLTVEPGLYIAEDAAVDAQWRGIGVRIEDDVLVTTDGFENLSAAIPKTVDDLEAAARA